MKEKDRILVAVVGKTVYVKPFGYATQRTCLGLPDFLRAMLREGCTSVAFDLAQCDGMDSTFLGVIASAALSGMEPPGKRVIMLNAGEHVRRELHMIGLMDYLAFSSEGCQPPRSLKLSRIDFVHLPATERERLQRIKDLHEELIKLNEKNRRNFGPFVKMLGEELAKT